MARRNAQKDPAKRRDAIRDRQASFALSGIDPRKREGGGRQSEAARAWARPEPARMPRPRPEQPWGPPGAFPAGRAVQGPGSFSLRPFDPAKDKPRANPDGSFSTEITRTVQTSKGWANVPSLWWGPNGAVDLGHLNDDQLAKMAGVYEQQSSKSFPRFQSLQEAETGARQRSTAGGGTRGKITEPPEMTLEQFNRLQAVQRGVNLNGRVPEMTQEQFNRAQAEQQGVNLNGRMPEMSLQEFNRAQAEQRGVNLNRPPAMLGPPPSEKLQETIGTHDPPPDYSKHTLSSYFENLPGTSVTYNIRDKTVAEGMTPQALQILESARAGASAIGLDRIEVVAAKGGGHKSHQSGTEWDLVGYQADGTKWTNEQRATVAQAAKRSGADRFGLYGMNFGLGKGTLHLGYSGGNRPAAIWGAKGLTSGPLSRRFSDPTERAFAQGDIAMPPHLLDEAREARVQEAHRGLPQQQSPAPFNTQLPTDPRLAMGPPSNLGPPPRQPPIEMTMAEFNREQAQQQGVNLNQPQSRPPSQPGPFTSAFPPGSEMPASPQERLASHFGPPPQQTPYNPLSSVQAPRPPQAPPSVNPNPLTYPNRMAPGPLQGQVDPYAPPTGAFRPPPVPMAALLNPDRTKDDAVAPSQAFTGNLPRARPAPVFAGNLPRARPAAGPPFAGNIPRPRPPMPTMPGPPPTAPVVPGMSPFDAIRKMDADWPSVFERRRIRMSDDVIPPLSQPPITAGPIEGTLGSMNSGIGPRSFWNAFDARPHGPTDIARASYIAAQLYGDKGGRKDRGGRMPTISPVNPLARNAPNYVAPTPRDPGGNNPGGNPFNRYPLFLR